MAQETNLHPSERRKFPRIDAVIKVSFRSRDEFISTYSRNISKGGIFLKMETLPDPNAQVELEFVLPGEEKPIRVLGRVVRLMSASDPDHAGKLVHDVGIAFLNLDEDSKNQLERFYQDNL